MLQLPLIYPFVVCKQWALATLIVSLGEGLFMTKNEDLSLISSGQL
jgi:hypothetical protein